MTRHTEETRQPDEQLTPGGPDTQRRRLLRAGVTSSLLLTIASRPAWAQGGQCTASALGSANASGGFDFDGCSISAGWWKDNQDRWPVDSNLAFHEVFDAVYFDGNLLYHGLTLGQVIMLNGGSDPIQGKLGFFLVGALLNAEQFPNDQGVPGFDYTPQQIKDLYSALDGAPLSSFQMLAATLDAANNKYDNAEEKPW